MFFTKRFFLIPVVLLFFAIRYVWAIPEFDVEDVGFYRGQLLTIQGAIKQPPEGNVFFIASRQFRYLDHWFPLYGIIVVHSDASEDFHYGDFVEINGTLDPPFPANPRIAGSMRDPKIRLLEANRGNALFAALFRLKAFVLYRLERVFPEPHASFASGLLVGSRHHMPADLTEDFRRTGLTHILALSGYNVVLLIGFLSVLKPFLSRKFFTTFCLVFISLFTLAVGASPSIVRAALMGSLGLMASYFGRPPASLRSVFLAAFIMLMADPLLLHDVGFQLSFAATVGIILFARGHHQNLLRTTWGAQVFTLPLVLYYFKGFSLLALFANLAVLPFIPILMLGSFASLFLGKILAAPISILFEVVLRIIHFFASLPFAFVEVGTS